MDSFPLSSSLLLLSDDSSLVFRLCLAPSLIPHLTRALYGESFMCERRKRRWSAAAADSQSAVTSATVVGRVRGIGRRRNDGASGERAATPTPGRPAGAPRRSTLSIVGRLSTAAGFTVVTRHRHQLAEPPSRRIMTLYRSLAISPSQLARRLIAAQKNNIRRTPRLRGQAAEL